MDWGVFRVPIDNCRKKTFEDPSITSNAKKERNTIGKTTNRKRLYGLDYGNILSKAGFEVVEDDYINNIDPMVGLNVMLCQKVKNYIFL